MKFPRDFRYRQHLFTAESFTHPAKTNLNLLTWLIQRYTLPGETILDPLGGIGSALIAATLQRPVVINELETHWVQLTKDNAGQIRAGWLLPQSPTLIIQGDAARLPLATASIPAIITSPPYYDTFSDWNLNSTSLQPGYYPAFGDDRGKPNEDKVQIGNIHIYETYLRAMMEVWRECRRVLTPRGLLIAILKDRVHHGHVVPIVTDNVTLLRILGFQLLETHTVEWPRSLYRNLHRQDADMPNHETVIILAPPHPTDHLAKRPLALVTEPKPNSAPGSAPAQLYKKTVAWAKDNGYDIYSLPDAKPQAKALERHQWCFGVVRHLVANHLIQGGHEIALFTPQRYAPHLQKRLETLGCKVLWPLHGLNMGQKLARLTKTLNTERSNNDERD